MKGLEPLTRVDPTSFVGFTLVSSYAELLALLGSNKRIRVAPNTLIPVTASFSLDGLSGLNIEGVGLHSGFDLRGVDFRAFDARNTSKIGLHQLRFVGDFDTLLPTRAGQGALVTDNPGANLCADLIVEGCYFDNLGGDALRIGPNSKGVKIVESTMRGGLGFIEISGVDVGGDTRPVSGVLIANNQVYGTVSGGRTGTLTGSDDMIDCYGGTNDLTIANNFFDLGSTAATTTTNSSGIVLLPDSGSGQGIIRKVDIHDNTFRRFNSTAALVPTQSAILVDANSFPAGFLDLNIHDNVIDDCHFGISLTNSTSLGIKIQGNQVATCVRGIHNDASDDVIISSNIVRYPTDIGIYLQGERLNVRGNSVFLDASLAGNKTGIWSTTGDNKLIQSNIIVGPGVASCFLIRVVSGDNTRVFDNTTVDSLGTGLDISSTATNTRLRGNHSSGNSVADLSNADTSEIVRDLTGIALPVFPTNAAAIAGGLAIGETYRSGGDPDLLCIRQFSPAEIAGLKLWLNAESLSLNDGDLITTWPDLSGNGNNATAVGGERPTFKTSILNSRPVARFDGSDDYMSTSLSIPTKFTAFIVYTNRTGTNGTMLGSSDTLLIERNTQIFQNANTSVFTVSSLNAHQLLVLVFDYDGDLYNAFSDGAANGSDTTVSAALSATFTVGDRGPGASEFLNGDIAEVLVYDSLLTTLNRQRIEGYLNGRYAMY